MKRKIVLLIAIILTLSLSMVACKQGDIGEALDRLAPAGIDIYFDNAGGAIQQPVFSRLKHWLPGRGRSCPEPSSACSRPRGVDGWVWAC